MADARPLRILNVNDDGAGRAATSRVLRDAGYAVIEAATGTEALRLAAAEAPDLVLLDVHLPDLRGADVCRRLRGDPATASLAVVHLSATSGSIADGLEGGADASLVEPVEPLVLLATVRALLRAHQAEQALRENQARLSTLAEAVPHMVWSADEHGEIDYFNQRAYEYGGAPAGGVHHWNLARIVHPEDKQRTLWAWRRAFRTGGTYEIEHRLRRGDGQYRWHLTRGLPVRDAAGRISRWIGTATDIHGQKQAAEALRESETRYHRLFETMQEGMAIVEVITDAHDRPVDYRYVDVNPMMERYHRGVRDEMVGRTYTELVPHPDPQWVVTVGAVALTGEPCSGERHSPVTGRWLRYRAYSPAPGQCAFIFEDVTERKQAEEALQRTEAELREAQRVAHVGSWYWHIATDAVTASEEVFRMVDLDPTSSMSVLRDREIHFYTPASHQRVVAAVQEALQTGAGYELDIEARRPDGTPLWISVRAEVVRGPDGRVAGLRGTNQDITVRRRVEEEREQLYERLLAAERARAELAEGLNNEIAHRVKNNLAMISGLLQMQLLSEPDPATGAALRDAVSRVRTFAMLQEQMYAQPRESVDLLEAVRRITDATRSVFSSRQEVELVVRGEPFLCCARDATNLSVIANELITNALKHGGPGEDGTRRIEVRLRCAEAQVGLSVWNSGPAVAESFQPGDQHTMGMTLLWDLVVEQYEGTFLLMPQNDGTLAAVTIPTASLSE